MAQAESRRMYSWWWDSHKPPKNSKWLQENLTDMDSKVNAMIKLIEEDADSFARRAEMYYKKRPELMKLVEEFYRAYRALAERYDHATGVLRQAQRTMAEVFPNKIPLVLADDLPATSFSDTDLRTPEMSTPVRAFFGAYTEESDTVTNRKGLKQYNNSFGSRDCAIVAEGRVRKGLNFQAAEDTEPSTQSKDNNTTQDQCLSMSEVVDKFEKEIKSLKDALTILEAQKEAGLAQYQQSLESLGKLKSEVSHAQEDSRGLNERANRAESEVQTLREALTTLEAVKEASHLQYQQCLARIADLEKILSQVKDDASELDEQAHNAEAESQALKQDAASLESEKAASFDRYKQSPEMISTLENKLLLSEEDARKLSERAIKGEMEIETLKQALAQLTEAKDEQFSALQIEVNKLFEMNNELRLKVKQKEQKEEVLATEIENLYGKLSDMQGACDNLQKENSKVLQENRSLTEQLLDLEEKNRTLENLPMSGETLSLRHLFLKESSKNSEGEWSTVTSFGNQLINEIANGKDLLSQKDIELSQAVQKLTDTENEKLELEIVMEDLKREIDEVKMVRDDQEKQILKLCEEHEKTKSRSESLFFEVQTEKNEIDMWESEATNLFGELQISAVFQTLLEEKVHELTEACKSVEDGITSKDMHIELVKQKISTLEGENGAVKNQFASFVPAVISLKDCISSLENHPSLHAKLQQSHNEGVQDPELASCRNFERCEETALDAFSELKDLQSRVEAVEKAVIEMEQVNLNANNKLEAAMSQIEELQFKGGSIQENVKSTSEISELESELLMKDIMLDQVSKCSSYGISRREGIRAESQMLKSWDSADLDGIIGATVGNVKNIVIPPTEERTDRCSVEKELGVDKLRISRTMSEPRREMNKGKIWERLKSDAQKLTFLQITVQDLKRKVEVIEKSKKSKAFDQCVILKEQLDEAEEAIPKFFDLNGKLMKSVVDEHFSDDSKSAMDSGESGIVLWRISEQARRECEKIARLQLEVEKIQVVLLKLDDGNGKPSKGTETRRRVTLHDYLYGATGQKNLSGAVARTGNRKRNSSFCACGQPSTSGDY